MLNFLKYQGAGNDFVMVDNRDGSYDSLTISHIQKVCDRRFGIGADGLIKINSSPSADFEVDYYNADGTKSFCGNGARCAVAFVRSLGLIKETYSFFAIDGLHEAFMKDHLVHLKMNDVADFSKDGENYILHTGSPHFVQKVSNVDEMDVRLSGREIRMSPRYRQEGINVNFIQTLAPNCLRIRTYERGVEDETLSCGTGITAAALVHAIDCNLYGTCAVDLKAQGGDLNVTFNREETGAFSEIWLIGPAEFVFSGSIDV